jgi:hypothetical protein
MPREEVELALPGAIFGGDPRGFNEFLNLNCRPLGEGRWSVWPTNDKGFISHHCVADDTNFMNRFGHLTHMPLDSVHLEDLAVIAGFANLDKQLAERMEGTDDIAALFHQIQVDIMKCSSHQQLIEVVEHACALLATHPSPQPSDGVLFPHLSAHLVVATDLLIRRVRLPAVLFRFDQDPDALLTLSNIGNEGGYFASATNWFHEVISASHYFGPLMGCLSPGFWCVPSGRPPASILFSLGRSIAGQRRTPMEPMQLLPGMGRDEHAPAVDLSPNSCRIAMIWWTNRLNQMFGYLCDPTAFSNKYGVYDPYEHQNWLLTFGQLFGLTTALQTSNRNHVNQRALMNTLLDTYSDRIMNRRFDQICMYTDAKETADRVRAQMPDMVAALLMPLADRAVDALRRVQDGFFFREQRGDKNVVVRIPGSDKGHHREPELAAAILLKVYRNATHGFGGLKPPQKDKDLVAERLLSHHNGDIPDDLVYLPYLYLLDALCDPTAVRETIVKHACVRG